MADQNKNIYSVDEIQRIYSELYLGALLVPVTQPGRPGFQPGPHFFIYRMYSEMGLAPADALVAFWEALQESSTLNAIDEFSMISANLTEPKVGDGQIQMQMIQRYVDPELRVRLLQIYVELGRFCQRDSPRRPWPPSARRHRCNDQLVRHCSSLSLEHMAGASSI